MMLLTFLPSKYTPADRIHIYKTAQKTPQQYGEGKDSSSSTTKTKQKTTRISAVMTL
jgi:hypothetical protein